MSAFNRMALIVGAFTRHMKDMNRESHQDTSEYDHLCHYMQSCHLMSDSGI